MLALLRQSFIRPGSFLGPCTPALWHLSRHVSVLSGEENECLHGAPCLLPCMHSCIVHLVPALLGAALQGVFICVGG